MVSRLFCVEKIIGKRSKGSNCFSVIFEDTIVIAESCKNPNHIPIDHGSRMILTPHPGEFIRLFHGPLSDRDSQRKKRASKASKQYGPVVVLKGHHTVVTAPGRRTYVNPTGNPGMATGGTGDVLTGMIAALAGQGLNAWDAARFGVYLHGLAGDIASRTTGQMSLIASDIIKNTAGAMHHIISGADQHRDLYLHPNPFM